MLIIALAARNGLRNVQRTLLTAGTIVFGTALLTLALSWMEGIFGGMVKIGSASSGHVRVVDADYARREDLFPLYDNLPDVDATVARIKAVPGVVSAYPRITAGVTLTAGDEIGDVFGLAVGAPLEWYTGWLDVDEHITGRFLENDDDIVLGGSLADQVHVGVGDEVVLLGQTQDGALSPVKGTVVGIVRAGNALLDQQVYLTLPKMQYMADIDGGATEILVYGEDRTESLELKDALLPLFDPEKTKVQAWNEREPYASLMTLGDTIKSILSTIIVFITALGVLNTMMMSVLERTSEIGVLRAMGLSRGGAVFLFVFEALAIAVLGGVVGVGFGSIGAYYLEVYGVSIGSTVVQNMSVPLSSRMYADLTPHVMTVAFLLGLLMAVVGSATPALRAASIQPVAAMRSRR
jgi:putative ABC transport system permease protein